MARNDKRRVAAAGLSAAIMLMGGCSMFHENVKGGFTCQAPKGVCAPSSTIDDAALVQIGGNHGGDILPASVDAMAMAEGAPVKRRGRHAAAVAAVSAPASMMAMGGRPALRVVHPAWVDEQGHRHERTTDYTYVDTAPALAYDAPAVREAALGGDGADRSLLGVAVRAPEAGVPVAVVSPAASGTDPNAIIRAKVDAILARAPKPMISVPVPVAPVATPAPVATVAAGPVQSAGVFPPAGS